MVEAELAELAQHGVTPTTTYEEFKDGFLASRPMGYGSHSLLARGLYALQVGGICLSCRLHLLVGWMSTGMMRGWGGIRHVSRIKQSLTKHTYIHTHTQPWNQLQPWLDAFPREQLLVLFMDDMRTPEATHAQVGKVKHNHCQWINLLVHFIHKMP